MYIYMGMFFNSQQDVPDFGSIAMYFVGTKDLGYVEEGHKRFRKYTFQSTDLSKLSLITNAIDGSEAFAVDTGTTYVLYDGQWSIKSSDLTPSKMAEMLGNITQIDYQVVNQLPQTGIKGTIYLVAHSHGDRDIYDEYIWTKDNDNNNIYEKIGNTDIDLTEYVNKNEIQYLSQYQYDNLPPLEKNNNIYITNEGFFFKNIVIYRKNIPINSSTVDFNDSKFFQVGGDLPGQCFYPSPMSLIKTFINAPTSFSRTQGFILKVQAHEGLDIGQTCYIQTLIQSRTIFRRIVTHISYAGGSYSYGDWKKIYPIEDFIPKVTDEAGEIPKFKEDGTLESSGFTIQSSVPSNAVFTDTTYTLTQDQLDGHKMTFTSSNGNATIITIPDNNTTYEDATQSVHGLMSSADKTKLDGITISDYLRKDDIVTLTAAEYEALVTKTAPYYFITDV